MGLSLSCETVLQRFVTCPLSPREQGRRVKGGRRRDTNDTGPESAAQQIEFFYCIIRRRILHAYIARTDNVTHRYLVFEMRIAFLSVVSCSLVRVAVALPMLDRPSLSLSLHAEAIRRGVFEDRGITISMNTAAPTGKAKSSSHSAGQYISLGTSSRSSTISFLPAFLGIPNLRPLVALEEDEQDTEPISALPQRPAPSVQSRPAPAGGTAEPEQDASGWIEAHNNYRKQYGAPPLLWDETLSQKAQSNAELCSHSHSSVSRPAQENR